MKKKETSKYIYLLCTFFLIIDRYNNKKANMFVGITLVLCTITLLTFLINLKLKSKRVYNNYTLVPYRYPIIGHLFEFLGDANKFILENSMKYGSIFTANILGQRLTFLLDLRDLHTMNKNTNLVFSGNEMVCDIFGSRRIEKGNQMIVSLKRLTIFIDFVQTFVMVYSRHFIKRSIPRLCNVLTH